ncbi:MAG: Lrp/AsnC family transcriptional regulator [Acidobacteriota bacterium]
MDEIDRKILKILQHDCYASQAEIASRVGLSTPSVNERIRKLEKGGIIRKYVAILDCGKIGIDITAFIEVFIEHPKHESLFAKEMKKLKEVQECHFVTGEGSCLLKVKAQNRLSLKNLLLDKINSMTGVRGTRTILVLSTAKEEISLNLDDREVELESRGNRTGKKNERENKTRN